MSSTLGAETRYISSINEELLLTFSQKVSEKWFPSMTKHNKIVVWYLNLPHGHDNDIHRVLKWRHWAWSYWTEQKESLSLLSPSIFFVTFYCSVQIHWSLKSLWATGGCGYWLNNNSKMDIFFMGGGINLFDQM